MNLENSCIVCGASQNLDTMLTVALENEKYTVAVCEEHAEDITPKKAKELVGQKVQQLNEALALIGEFGLQVNKSSGGIAVAEKPQEQKPIQEDSDTVAVVETEQEEEKPKIEKKVQFSKDGKTELTKRARKKRAQHLSLGGAVSGATNANIEKHQGFDLDSSVSGEIAHSLEKGTIKEAVKPESQIVEEQAVTTKSRGPLIVPKKVSHNIGGETTIEIVNTGGDENLQRRFKEFAQHTKESNNPHGYARGGYDTIECTLCKGNLRVKNKGVMIQCPKCKGTGVLNKGF
jgi:hypothetical protein